MERICKNCKWWLEILSDDREGMCWRFPKWEKTNGCHWCGEFEAKSARENDTVKALQDKEL